MAGKYNYETILVTILKPFVYHVELNRPEKLNCMNTTMWMELKKVFEDINLDKNCRVVIFSGAGKLFTAGLDFQLASEIKKLANSSEDVARKGKTLHDIIKGCQESITQLELCGKPVLIAVHSACVGAGTSLLSAADMRYCTKDAWFQIKEVALGICADVGVLQRLPKIIGSDSLFRELCYTGRKLSSSEALTCGLVSKVFDDKESMLKGVLEVAEDIASKSPVTIATIKKSILYSRDHTVQDGLNHIVDLNQFLFQSEDFDRATNAVVTNSTDVSFKEY